MFYEHEIMEFILFQDFFTGKMKWIFEVWICQNEWQIIIAENTQIGLPYCLKILLMLYLPCKLIKEGMVCTNNTLLGNNRYLITNQSNSLRGRYLHKGNSSSLVQIERLNTITMQCVFVTDISLFWCECWCKST